MMYHIPRATELSGNTSFASTTYSGTSTTATRAPHYDSKELSSTTKAVIGSVTSCLAVAIILIILGVYFYSRRRRRKYSTENPRFVFGQDVFAKSALSPELDKYAMADLVKLNTLSPVRYRESSSTSTFDDNTIGRQPEGNPSLKIANADADEKIPTATLAFPQSLAENKRRTPRGKPTWLSPITTKEEDGSPLPTYGMSNAGQESLIPIPSQRPQQKSTPMSSSSSVTRQSFTSVKSKTSQSLIIPDFDLLSVVSPARSESFAPKDLVLPSPPPTPASITFGLGSDGSQIGSSRVQHDQDVELPRLMNVVALFTPNLSDELYVRVGDTVRIIEEYKDGWCFAQFLGKDDAPKGVVPLACLRDSERLTPFKHRASNKSWRA